MAESLPSPSDVEPVTALSSDDPVVTAEPEPSYPSYSQSRTTSPTPNRLPGYIPGMPRPMTPHDSTPPDEEDNTPSATPRATSHRLPTSSSQPPLNGAAGHVSNMIRSNSSSSTARQSPRPTTPQSIVAPLFFNRSVNGRYTPEDRSRNGGSSPTNEESPLQSRRRPISPLSGPAFQPMSSVGPSSRPSTPSNVTWNPPASPNAARHTRSGSVSGHNRNGSTASVGPDGPNNSDDAHQQHASTRPLRSPTLPDSPWGDNGRSSAMDYRPGSAMSGADLGSPVQIANRPLRSPTPTHNGTYSPTSPTFQDAATNGNVSPGFSRRSSRQTAHNSFQLASAHQLLLSPFANSSHSSLESVGSSYHSWDEDHKKDRLFTLLSNIDAGQPAWHDVSNSTTEKSSSSNSGAGTGVIATPFEEIEDPEELVRREIGLTRSDFIAIQDKLVFAALTKSTTPEERHRAASLRRRRPSTSQSNYSYNGGDHRVSPCFNLPRPLLTQRVLRLQVPLPKRSHRRRRKHPIVIILLRQVPYWAH